MAPEFSDGKVSDEVKLAEVHFAVRWLTEEWKDKKKMCDDHQTYINGKKAVETAGDKSFGKLVASITIVNIIILLIFKVAFHI